MIDQSRSPCQKCGSIKLTKRGACAGCKALSDAAYHQANKEKISKSNAERYQKNRAERLEKAAAYRRANPEKVAAYSADHYKKNKAKINAKSAIYYAENRERVAAAVAEYRRANKEKVSASKVAWRVANPATINLHSRNRRARVRNAPGKLSPDIERRLFKLQRGRCACCRLPLGRDYHLDHIVPLVLGGENSDTNVQLLRARCNLQKNKKHPVDFMQSRGFLL